MSSPKDVPSLSMFFNKAGRLVPPEAFVLMLDLLDDTDVLVVLDDLCKLHENNCGFYCPLVMDCLSVFSLPRAWPSQTRSVDCFYLRLAQHRLWLLSKQILFGIQPGECPKCYRPGVILTVNVRRSGLWRCCVSCFKEYGGEVSIVWHEEVSNPESSE